MVLKLTGIHAHCRGHSQHKQVGAYEFTFGPDFIQIWFFLRMKNEISHAE